MTLRCGVFSTNYRNLENWMTFFSALEEDKTTVDYYLLPWTGDPSNPLLDSFKGKATYFQPINQLTPDGLSVKELTDLCAKIAASKLDFLFLCDVLSYPSSEIKNVLSNYKKRPAIIGLQHGIYQKWWEYNYRKCFDFLFVFGSDHYQMLSSEIQNKTSIVGLPKLDQLKNKANAGGEDILFLPQRYPDPHLLAPCLLELSSKLQTKITIRHHPQHPSSYQNLPNGSDCFVFNQDPSVVDAINKAKLVITFHSTAVVESLYLGKPVVILPSHGLTAFSRYPAIAIDYSAAAILQALDSFKTYSENVNQFIKNTVGGIRFDHTSRTRKAFNKIKWKQRLSCRCSF